MKPLDYALGGAVAVLGLARVVILKPVAQGIPILIVLGMAAAVALYRRAPGVALALVWLTAIVQVVSGFDVALVQAAAVIVAYGTARHGSTPVLIASVLSIPLGGIAAVLYARFAGIGEVLQDSGLRELLGTLISISGVGIYDVPTGLLIGFVLVAAILGAPWALGLVLRLRERSRTAEREREEAEVETARAQQLAEVRSEQARLARDVHDVVGHSLAVIVAQADSAKAMSDDQIGDLRSAMANIAETARRSLHDVRAVLSDQPATASATPDLDDLIDGVRSSGTDVDLDVTGTSRPLPPELEVVAYRTLQELLTNALKHGMPGASIRVSLDWRPNDLVITTRNRVADQPGPGGRTGLDGVRDRLAAVGGRMQAGPDGDDWVTTAHVPVRSEGGIP